MAKQLLNEGQRLIMVSETDFFKPKQVMEMPDELAEKLLSLYPDEIRDLGAKVEYTPDVVIAATPEATEDKPEDNKKEKNKAADNKKE